MPTVLPVLARSLTASFATIGEIPADEIKELSGGRLAEPVKVSLNRRIFDYDQIIICGPTFPHEVVGFSGGNKYFFPGIGGILDLLDSLLFNAPIMYLYLRHVLTHR